MYKQAPRFLLGLSLGFFSLVGAGCHRDLNATGLAATPDNSGPDPAAANMAPVNNSQPAAAPAPATQGAVLGIRSQAPAPQQSYEQYPPQQAAPPPPDQDQDYQDAQTAAQLDEEGETPPVEYADQPPPPLPVYEQPEASAPNYIWTPGYWYWGPAGYYWIPGAWCAPPYYGALWTPGYWGWYHNRWGFHRGFWGLHIGFYGGINYGFGYTGVGYYGGYWNGNNFYYNRAVNRISPRITYVYNRTVVINNNTRIAYNGGRGGLAVRPQPAEVAAMRGPRIPPMSTQIQNQREAAQNRQQFYNVNRGRPAMVAAPRPIAAQPGFTRPNPGSRPGQPEVRPVQPGVQPTVQPGTRPGFQTGAQPGGRPSEPATRPVQPDNRPQIQPVHPGQSAQPDNRPAPPQARPVQPQQPQIRPVQPETRPVQPQSRPDYPEQPQNHPVQSQYRSSPQPAPQPRPQTMERPAPQQHPAPQQEFRSAPQPQSRPAPPPQERPAPHQQSTHEGRPQSQNGHPQR
jgi:WXXGXW repeat (2 copies)